LTFPEILLEWTSYGFHTYDVNYILEALGGKFVALKSKIMRLSKANINKLHLSDDRYEITDNKIAGFKLRIGQKKKVFIIRYRLGSLRRTYTIGELGKWTPENARKKASQLLRLVDEGIDPAASKEKIRNAPTFEELAKDYLEYADKRSKKDDIGKLNNIYLPKLGKKPLNSITEKDIRAILKKLLDKGRSNATHNRYLALIKVMLNRAIQWGMLEVNPAAHIKPLKENPNRERYLSAGEIRLLLRVLDETPKNAANAIKVMLFTGQRAGNVMSARWSEFDDQGVWTIPLTKSGKIHRVYLSEEAKITLEEQREISGSKEYVFPGRRSNPHITCLEYIWKNIQEKTGLHNVRLHDLRHTFASWAINGGASLYDVQKSLGHSDLRVTQKYAHLSEERQREVSKIATQGMVINIEKYLPNKKYVESF